MVWAFLVRNSFMRKTSDTAIYHVNPATGNAGLCKAYIGECPFGNADAHFPDAASARAMFEKTQEVFPKTMKKAKVFRIGPLQPQEKHFDDLQQVLQDFEETTPPGRIGRANGLFASPDIQSHGRWVLGIGDLGGNHDTTSHELTVNPNEVYVYPVELYEIASSLQSWGNKEKFLAAAKEYWDAGMTLAEWQRWAAKAKPEPGSWEVLVPPSENLNPKPVSNRRIIENASENFHYRLGWLLEPRRAQRSNTWPRKGTDEEAEDAS